MQTQCCMGILFSGLQERTRETCWEGKWEVTAFGTLVSSLFICGRTFEYA